MAARIAIPRIIEIGGGARERAGAVLEQFGLKRPLGVTDRFIAREFERHFLRLGVRAGIVGAIWAMFVFLIMPTVMELLGGGTVTITEIRRLIGTAALDPRHCGQTR